MKAKSQHGKPEPEEKGFAAIHNDEQPRVYAHIGHMQDAGSQVEPKPKFTMEPEPT